MYKLTNFLLDSGLGNAGAAMIIPITEFGYHCFFVFPDDDENLGLIQDKRLTIMEKSLPKMADDVYILLNTFFKIQGKLEVREDGEVVEASAYGGYGPYMYEAAMKLMPNGICPDQDEGELTTDAQRLWERFYDEAQNNSKYVLTPVDNPKYPEPYRNFYYKITGSCIADSMIEKGLNFLEKVKQLIKKV